MSQKETPFPYSSNNYPFFSQSRNGMRSIHSTHFSENTSTRHKTANSSDYLSLSTSHCVRMLKQKYQRKNFEKTNKVSEKYKAHSLAAMNIGENLSALGDNENAHRHSSETDNDTVQSPVRKTRVVSIHEEEFASYREALAKQAIIENQNISSSEIEQLCQQQIVFQVELGKIQESLQTLEEMLKEAQYDRNQRDTNIQSSMQRLEEEMKASVDEMKNKISASIQETKQLLSLKLSDLQNTIVEIHSCLLASTEFISDEQKDM